MLTLPNVTLCCVDCVNHELAGYALQQSLRQCQFGAALFFTDQACHIPQVETIEIPKIESSEAYSHFILRKLNAYIHTEYVLIIQWDGFVVNAAAWDPAFLAYDYIGAPWIFHDDLNVGNGGFSLRSKKLLEALQDPYILATEPEDYQICRIYRRYLEQQHAICFAPEALAKQFACEIQKPDPSLPFPFGFHDIAYFHYFMSDAQLFSLALFFEGREKWQHVRTLCQAILKRAPTHSEAHQLLKKTFQIQKQLKKPVWHRLDPEKALLEKPNYFDHVRTDLINMIQTPPTKVLEIGCSMGGTLEGIKILYPNAYTIGIEAHPPAAKIARQKMDQLFACPFEDIDLALHRDVFSNIDLVILGDILEHLYNPWQLLEQLHAMLTPTARLIVSIPNIRNLSVLQNLLLNGEFPYSHSGILDITHLRFFTLKEMQQMFTETGYEIIYTRRALDVNVNLTGFEQLPDYATFDIDTPALTLKNISVADAKEFQTLQFLFILQRK